MTWRWNLQTCYPSEGFEGFIKFFSILNPYGEVFKTDLRLFYELARAGRFVRRKLTFLGRASQSPYAEPCHKRHLELKSHEF